MVSNTSENLILLKTKWPSPLDAFIDLYRGVLIKGTFLVARFLTSGPPASSLLFQYSITDFV